MKLVFALVLISYSAISQEVTRTKIMSYHSHSVSCLQTMNRERFHGRQLHYNESYVCLQVKDSVAAAELKRLGNSDRVIVHGTRRFLNRPNRHMKRWNRQ